MREKLICGEKESTGNEDYLWGKTFFSEATIPTTVISLNKKLQHYFLFLIIVVSFNSTPVSKLRAAISFC